MVSTVESCQPTQKSLPPKTGSKRALGHLWSWCKSPWIQYPLSTLLLFKSDELIHLYEKRFLLPTNILSKSDRGKIDAAKLLFNRVGHEMNFANTDKLEVSVSSKFFLNAWTASHRWSKNPRVYLSDTILSHFSTEQLKGVFAHEVSHIKNNHMLITGFAVIGISGLIDFTAKKVTNKYFPKKEDKKRVIKKNLVMLGVELVGLTACAVIACAIMRQCEYNADWTAAQDPEKCTSLRNALSEFKRLTNAPTPRFWGAFEDHPSTDARIANLNKLCPAS